MCTAILTTVRLTCDRFKAFPYEHFGQSDVITWNDLFHGFLGSKDKRTQISSVRIRSCGMPVSGKIIQTYCAHEYPCTLEEFSFVRPALPETLNNCAYQLFSFIREAQNFDNETQTTIFKSLPDNGLGEDEGLFFSHALKL